MDITVTMPQDEYEKQLWILNMLGSLQDKVEKTASSEEIREILIQEDTPFTEDSDLEDIEERLEHFEKLGIVSIYRSNENWILDSLDLDSWE